MTPHFSLKELTASSTAERLRITNTPALEHLSNLHDTAAMLEYVREELGYPVIVTSGYRCPTLNKAVGGVTSSDHVSGQAADVVAPKFGTPYEMAKRLAPLIDALGIGQIILEGVKGKQWLHLSTRKPVKTSNRVITITDKGPKLGIQQIK